MTPFQMVVQELTERGSMSQEEYTLALRALFDLLHDRALVAIKGPDDATALAVAQQYCAFGELVTSFGTALIAAEDIEDADVPVAELMDDGPDEPPPSGEMN